MPAWNNIFTGLFASRPPAAGLSSYIYMAYDTGQAFRSDGAAWTLVPLGSPYLPLTNIAAGDSPSIDAFARLRVSNPVTLLDVKMNNGISAARWIQSTANGGSITASQQCAADVACTAAASSSSILQTKQRGVYQAGKSLVALLTFNFNVASNGTANIRKRVGMFDENDGCYLEQNGTDVRIVLRTNTTGTPSGANAITKANWNIDKFDGTGPSGITLDFTKTQILFMDLEWLGVGRVRVGFVVNGLIYYAHQFLNTNSLAVPYMANPNLPCRYECVQTASANTGTMLAICCTVMSEGGYDTLGRLTSQPTPVAGRTNLGAVRDEVLSIRLNAASIRKGLLLPEGLSVFQVSQAYLWELVLNATPSGTVGAGSWVAVDASSNAEYNITRTATTGFTGGYCIASGVVATALDSFSGSLNTTFPVGQLDLTPSSDVLSLLVTTLNAFDQTYNGSSTWRSVS